MDFGIINSAATGANVVMDTAGTMTLTNITGTTVPASNTTNGSGTLKLNTGGTLAVGANQNSGAYAGTYTVTLSY